MGSVRTVDSVNISCAYFDGYFCAWIPIWQESQWVGINRTFVLEGDASKKHQNHVK